MPECSPLQHVPEPATLPAGRPARTFDGAGVYRGPAGGEVGADAHGPGPPTGRGAAGALTEKLRQAHYWLVNTTPFSPFYDLEFSPDAPQVLTLGDSRAQLRLPAGPSYSSFVLLPRLNQALNRRCLLVGGPGRGKTSSAVRMGALAGYSLADVRRAMQHGQPQTTVADLEQPLAWASNAFTLAATSPHSHAAWLVAWVVAEAA